MRSRGCQRRASVSFTSVEQASNLCPDLYNNILNRGGPSIDVYGVSHGGHVGDPHRRLTHPDDRIPDPRRQFEFMAMHEVHTGVKRHRKPFGQQPISGLYFASSFTIGVHVGERSVQEECCRHDHVACTEYPQVFVEIKKQFASTFPPRLNTRILINSNLVESRLEQECHRLNDVQSDAEDEQETTPRKPTEEVNHPGPSAAEVKHPCECN